MKKNFLFILLISLTTVVFAGETTTSIRTNRINIDVDHTYHLNFSPVLDFYFDPEHMVNYVDQNKAKVKLVYNREEQSDITWSFQWRYSVTCSFEDLPGAPSHTLSVSSENGAEGSVYMDYAMQDLTLGLMESEITITSVTAEYYDGMSWVTAISSSGDPHLPNDIHLEFSVITNRYYKLEENTNTRLTRDITPETIDLKWNYIHGAEEYEMQWVFLDADMNDYALILDELETGVFDPESPFRIKEPLNIVVNYNHYELDNVYTPGLLFFRVRPIGRFIEDVDGDYSHIKTGAWSYYDTRPDMGEPVNTNYLCYHEITELNAFELNKSWVYSIGFSENGKFASGVSYFDGSMRNRQASAYSNTDNVTLKGESKYDYEGRMVVSLPPAPVHGRNLSYEAGFNTVTVDGLTEVFAKKHFDFDNSVIFRTLNDNNGISKYFSENNDFEQENQGAIPDANGYVYAQVKYKKDGSGRINESSGVGETFAMNGDHTSNYYYGSPTTTELRRLFGSNVSGNTNFYKKQMVQDANGQLSVAYLDGGGQTIATSLAGVAPDNLIDLDGIVESYTTVLNDGNFVTPDGNTLKSTFVFLNSVNLNTLSFTYDFTGIIYDFVDICEPPTPKCMDCLYEIGIRIIAPDGTLTEYTKDVSAATYTCGIDETYETDFTGAMVWHLDPYLCEEIGEYKIIKTLTIKKGEMLDAFSTEIECEGRKYNMIEEFTENVDISGCFTICDDFCAYLVGKDLGYTEAELTTILANPADPFYSDPIVIAAIDLCKIANCSGDEIFDGDLDDIAEGDIDGLDLPLFASQCEGFYSQMAEQVRPGGFHYIDEETFWVTVQEHIDEIGGAFELDFYTAYNVDGTGVLGTEISDADDLHDPAIPFKEEWVAELVRVHREYCHYLYCGELVDSKQFDAQFGIYISSTFGDTWPATAAGISALWGGTNPDPFIDLDFNYDAIDVDYVALQNYLESGYEYDGTTGLNIYEYIEEIEGGIVAAGGASFDDPTKWNLLRGLYSTAKQQIIDDFKTSNGCSYFEDDYAIFLSGSGGPDDGGDGELSVEDLEAYFAAFFDEFGDIFVPDVYEVCNANVASWMSSIPPTCLEELELAGTLDDLEAAFLDYCYEYCGPENPGGFFFNHDPIGSTDEKYNTVITILATCPDFELDFETEAPVTEILEGVVNQDFPACYLHMLSYINDVVLNDAALIPAIGASFSIPIGSPLYGCGIGVDLKFWEIETFGGKVFLSEYDDGGPDQPCNNFFGLQSFDGTIDYTLAEITHVANLVKMIYPGTSDEIVKADLTLLDGSIVAGRVLYTVGGCYNPGNFDDMEIITEFPGDLTFTFPDWEADCIDFIYDVARQNAINAYNALISQAKTNFLNELDCFTGVDEKFTMSYALHEYQYTLFYYDQTGQLVQTVPPSGVDILTNAAFPGGVWNETEPSHNQKTIYTYNGAGLLLESETPDGGLTTFYYDDLYRLRFAQNALQAINNRFSYTKYDELGRPTEAGEAGDISITMPDLSANVNDNSFPASTIVRDYTKSYYEQGFNDIALSDINAEFNDGQKNLRGTVGAIEKYTADFSVSAGEIIPEAGTEFRMITSFSYDPHGMVNEMVQTNYFFAMEENEHKHIAYEYDLISGNVEEVIYQEGELDEWRHQYHYDAANRLIRVFTSNNGEEWDMDAKYFYYLHGSLARVEKGHDKIQGMDFAYNLQGWLKGINSTTLSTSADIGQDGHTTGLDKFSGADANGFSLGYYKNDYAPILGSNAFASTDVLMDANATYGELFNGNISTMVTAMKNTDEALMTTQGNVYRYDLLQRIKQMDTYQVTDVANFNATNAFSLANSSTTGKYGTTYSFDANGNLMTLTRKDDAGVTMDDFTYNYLDLENKNQLGHVDDLAGAGVSTNDLDDQAALNYEYDQVGQLIRDDEANITNINWTADGKVRKITFDPATSKPELRYVYDASGNRVLQITGEPNTVGALYEFYVYDASGNLMATYEQYITGNVIPGNPGPEDAAFTEHTILKDQNIYGAARVGSKIVNKEIYSRNFDVSGGDFVAGQTTVAEFTHTENIDKTKRIVGYKQYEMANHLGNVLNVVTDRKVGNVGGTGYEADIVSYSDYYPYGMILPGRHGTLSGAEGYRYGFQGQEMDDEVKGEGNSVNYKYRMHDPRIGRFFAVDPLAPKYPKWSPYAFSGNQVIHSVELEGLETEVDLDPSENGKFIGTPRDSDGHLDREYKLNSYNDSRSYFTFTLGQQPWRKKSPLGGDPSAGNPFGKATNGTTHYSTDVRHPFGGLFKKYDEAGNVLNSNDLSEGNHSFGITYGFANTNFEFGMLYTKQKIRGDNLDNGYNLEAPASLTYNFSYRFGIGSSLQRDLNFGITPEIGIGQTIATLRAKDIPNSNIKNVGISAAFNIKFDASYRHFSIYLRAQSTYFNIAPQIIDIYGEQLGKQYGIALLTTGVTYSIHIEPIGRWADGKRAFVDRKN